MFRLAAFLLVAPMFASAAPLIHRCVDADGEVSYQQTPCPPDNAEVTIPIRADDVRPSPLLPLFVPPEEDIAEPPITPRQADPPPISYLCATADGTRFYRHDGCPAQLAVRQPYIWVGDTPVTIPVFVPVHATEVPRESACRAIYDRGASRRTGSQHDERYSVYQRATGRDPCR
ncbi:MAG TPA: DUF4124 domain-containing protein [Xanthomonadaceae bacterium]|nr:DUF4124 domain-containing protein [Xanthomonadaceae bacterium]